MASSKRPEHYINLSNVPQLGSSQPQSGSSTAATSPIEPSSSSSSLRFPLGSAGNAGGAGSGVSRMNSSSPSHEYGGRLYPKRYAYPFKTALEISTNSSRVEQEKFKHKRALARRSGARQRADTRPRFEKQSRSLLMAKDFPTLRLRPPRPHPASPQLQEVEFERERCHLVSQLLRPALASWPQT
jgi:hypothetical protein